MAANAYVLINVEPSKSQTILERLRDLQGAIVREVLGPYDIVVELEADTPEDLTAVLRNQIRPLPGIVSTTTCTWY